MSEAFLAGAAGSVGGAIVGGLLALLGSWFATRSSNEAAIARVRVEAELRLATDIFETSHRWVRAVAQMHFGRGDPFDDESQERELTARARLRFLGHRLDDEDPIRATLEEALDEYDQWIFTWILEPDVERARAAGRKMPDDLFALFGGLMEAVQRDLQIRAVEPLRRRG